VLVRNPYFNMTFTVPAVVRSGEQFSVYATVTNISQADWRLAAFADPFASA
jgi:hypothetical protein